MTVCGNIRHGGYAETEDADIIKALIDADQRLQVGNPTDMSVDDLTDKLSFDFKDETAKRLIF